MRAAISYRLGPLEGGKPGGRRDIIFLWAARGSRRGCGLWLRFGSEPNRRVLGISGFSKEGLMRFSGSLPIGREGGMPGIKD